jgi:hypothetical protein
MLLVAPTAAENSFQAGVVQDPAGTVSAGDTVRSVPDQRETELMFVCHGVRYSIRFRERFYAERFKRTFGDNTDAGLLSLVAGPQVVRGPGRSRAWRLFERISNIESVVPSCSATGAELTVRAMDEIAAWSARGTDKPPVLTWIISMTPDAKADVRAGPGANVY